MNAPLILLVEDNPDDEDLMRLVLGNCGVSHRLAVARDGAEALEFLSDTTRQELPDLVLLDLKMPKIGGLEVLERIRVDERLGVIPVVVLSSSREVPDITRAYRLGANSYIRKPVEFERFEKAVRRITRYWLGLNEPPFPRPEK